MKNIEIEYVLKTEDDDDIQAYVKPWVGLTDDEREQIINANTTTGLWHMAKNIEAKLKDKNT